MALYNASSNTFVEWTSNPGDARLLDPNTQHIDGRSRPEMMVKAVLLLFIATIATNYLARLRKQPTKLAAYQVSASILVPTFPLADFMISFYRTFKAMRRTEKLIWSSYHNACILDVRASSESGEATVPLHLVPSAQVTPVALPYDTRWFVRLAIQFAFLLQMMYVMVIWGHRATYGRRAFYDDWIALTAFCGFQTMLLALGITIMNTTWTCPQRYPAMFNTRFAEATPFDLMTFVDPFEVQLAGVIAALFRFGTFLSLKNNFAVEYYHQWQADCLKKGIAAENSSQIISKGTKFLSYAFNVELHDCDPQGEWGRNSISQFIIYVVQINAGLAMVSGFILSWYAVILLAVIIFVPVCTLLNVPIGISKERWMRAIYWCHSSSGFVGYNILILGTWQLTNPSSVAWAWKWKDPWAGRYWTFTT